MILKKISPYLNFLGAYNKKLALLSGIAALSVASPLFAQTGHTKAAAPSTEHRGNTVGEGRASSLTPPVQIDPTKASPSPDLGKETSTTKSTATVPPSPGELHTTVTEHGTATNAVGSHQQDDVDLKAGAVAPVQDTTTTHTNTTTSGDNTSHATKVGGCSLNSRDD